MFSLSVPSKTFLAGEYSALFGGPALLLNTSPRFMLKANLCVSAKPQRVGLSEAGPAAELLKDPAFSDYDIQFVDPHRGLGGLGGSSAQFVLLHAFLNWLRFEPTRWEKTLKSYRNFAKSLNFTPSGYDVISQMKGRLTYVHMAQNKVETMEWPFREAEVVLVRGPLKIATHKHLEDLKLNDTAELVRRSSMVYETLKTGSLEQFLASMRSFGEILASEGLVASESEEVQKKVQTRNDVLAIKGCGAMGADVIMAVVLKSTVQSFKKFLVDQKLEIIATTEDLSPGLRIDEMSHGELQSAFESEMSYFKDQIAGSRSDVVS